MNDDGAMQIPMAPADTQLGMAQRRALAGEDQAQLSGLIRQQSYEDIAAQMAAQKEAEDKWEAAKREAQARTVREQQGALALQLAVGMSAQHAWEHEEVLTAARAFLTFLTGEEASQRTN